jgi:hypothetical protein
VLEHRARHGGIVCTAVSRFHGGADPLVATLAVQDLRVTRDQDDPARDRNVVAREAFWSGKSVPPYVLVPQRALNASRKLEPVRKILSHLAVRPSCITCPLKSPRKLGDQLDSTNGPLSSTYLQQLTTNFHGRATHHRRRGTLGSDVVASKNLGEFVSVDRAAKEAQ